MMHRSRDCLVFMLAGAIIFGTIGPTPALGVESASRHKSTGAVRTGESSGSSGGLAGDACGPSDNGKSFGVLKLAQAAAPEEQPDTASVRSSTGSASMPEENVSRSGPASMPAGVGSDQKSSSSTPAGTAPEKSVTGRDVSAPSGAATGSSQPAPAKPPEKPVHLFGRIEELCSPAVPSLKLKWKAMQPIRDTRLDARAKAGSAALAGQATAQAFPADFRGTWTGTMTVFRSAFDPSFLQFDREEASKQSRLMRPGTQGQMTVTFYLARDGKNYMQPCSIVFTATMDGSQAQQVMGGAGMGGLGGLGDMSALFKNMRVPYMFALHLGDLTSGVGVTGNQLSGKLVRSELRQLAPGVIENVVVDQLRDRNPNTGKVLESYGESVLRFTRMNQNQLYLQCASVNYRNDGKFLSKVILYGTLNRSSGAASAGMPLLQGFPTGAGGAGSAAQQLEQLQQLLKQMQQ